MVIITKYCECGNYQPISTSGVIMTECKNCGGSERPLVCGPGLYSGKFNKVKQNLKNLKEKK
jgi:hypothetical protein